MARSPISFSSQSSLSSEGEEEGYYDDGYFGYNNGGRQMSPTQESAVCLWEDCGREFDDLRALVAHVHGLFLCGRLIYRMADSLQRRPCRSTQVDIHLRMDNVSTKRFSSDLKIRSSLPFKITYRRETVYVSITRCAIICWLKVTLLTTPQNRMRQIIHPIRRSSQTHASPTRHITALTR
jgi:hypothetical protein